MGGNSGVSEEQVLYENEKLIRDELFMVDEKISRSENIINVIKKFEKRNLIKNFLVATLHFYNCSTATFSRKDLPLMANCIANPPTI